VAAFSPPEVELVASYDFAAQRLFVEDDLQEGGVVGLARPAAHYLLSVLRLGNGAEILVFNGRDGEWRARLDATGKRSGELRLLTRTRAQPRSGGPALLFAPLKHARLDYMVQKAVEMGAAALQPILTRRTIVTRVNLERMRANAIEAAEQCGILTVPHILPAVDLVKALAGLPPGCLLVCCDEEAPTSDPMAALGAAAPGHTGATPAILVGPEGGFDPAERDAILARPGTCRLSLGPRILRADTAAVAALALVQAVLGDWR
jgi:16S rRNA (uracil1498-N3)-methyltransferase